LVRREARMVIHAALWRNRSAGVCRPRIQAMTRFIRSFKTQRLWRNLAAGMGPGSTNVLTEHPPCDLSAIERRDEIKKNEAP
jgi:hypothetical protein